MENYILFYNVQLIFLIPIAHGGGIEAVLKFLHLASGMQQE